jgi:hydrogenase-4 membrane subunit HyfE
VTSAQAWIVIIELGIFNAILAAVVIITVVHGLRRELDGE